MANTYTQIYIHVVYAVKWRESLISIDWKERLHRYTTGIVQNQGHKLLAINTMPDHLHAFIGMRPDVSLSDLVRDVKKDSTNFVNNEMFPKRHFAWQEGFGAFSYSRSQIDAVIKYILSQENHHRKRTFRQEYESLLRQFEIEFDHRYVFKWPSDTQH
jgi:putative transposase